LPKRRPVYVYRLRIEYPENGLEPDWEPEGWRDHHDHAFTWPVTRAHLSETSAHHRAARFREYGATVTVERSKPVEWEPSKPVEWDA
jgi:hypothetical protein